MKMRVNVGFNWGIFFLLLIGLQACSSDSSNELNVEEALDYCKIQAQSTLDDFPGDSLLPRNILKGEREWNYVGIEDWTSGFWPGVLWYIYESTGDEKWEKEARKYTSYLAPLSYGQPMDHDLGFQIFCSYGNAYRLTADSSFRQVIIRTAEKLAKLYNPTVETILSWPGMVDKMNWPHNTIVDNMMNLEMLFWASKNGGDSSLYDLAFNHAEKSRKTLIRDDFTTYHVAVFDTVDGEFIKGVTHQGYSDESKWARGQAWGIYGFTMSYRETGYEPFLITAQKLADVFIGLLPADGIPFWDFDDPAIPNAPRDASAAAIAASSMLELSGLLKNEGCSQKYLVAATALLEQLSSDNYQSGTHNPAFLMHSTGHKPNNSEIDASINYADYYYLEALLRLKKMQENRK